MIWEETVFYTAGDARSGSSTDRGSDTPPARNTLNAQEDDGPHHGSTPPHGDMLGHQWIGDTAELDEDAEERPLVRG